MTDLTEALTIYLRAPVHVWPEEWRCRNRGENVYRGYQPHVYSEKAERLPRVLANERGVGWAEVVGAAVWLCVSAGLALASCAVLGVPPCCMSQLAQTRGAGISSSHPNHRNLLPRSCRLVYLRIPQRVFLSIPDGPWKIFIWKCEHKSRPLISQNSKRDKNNLVAICL